jgi:hypothetical protein
MKKKITIAICDLNAAVAVPWDTKTCLLAQAIKQELGSEVEYCGRGAGRVVTGAAFSTKSMKLWRLVTEFDCRHGMDRNGRGLSLIRQQLPFEVELEIIGPYGK